MGLQISLVTDTFSDLTNAIRVLSTYIHSGYTRSEQPVQAPNSSVWCCLATYAQTAPIADATFEFRPHECNKGLLPTIQLWLVDYKLSKVYP